MHIVLSILFVGSLFSYYYFLIWGGECVVGWFWDACIVESCQLLADLLAFLGYCLGLLTLMFQYISLLPLWKQRAESFRFSFWWLWPLRICGLKSKVSACFVVEITVQVMVGSRCKDHALIFLFVWVPNMAVSKYSLSSFHNFDFSRLGLGLVFEVWYFVLWLSLKGGWYILIEYSWLEKKKKKGIWFLAPCFLDCTVTGTCHLVIITSFLFLILRVLFLKPGYKLLWQF